MQSVRVVEVPAVPVARPPRSEALLSVRLPNRVTLSKALRLAIEHLKPGSPVDIVPPARRGGPWFLDTRATASRRLPQGHHARAEFATAHSLSAEHFIKPSGIGQPNGRCSRLTFRLGEEVTERVCVPDAAGRSVCGVRGTGYYRLLPV